MFDELAGAGFERSYPTLVRELRRLELRPVCLVCQQRRGRALTVELDHPSGEEIQWDWLELPSTPWGEPVYALVGALSCSGKFWAVLCERMTFGHLAGALHEILVAFGGTARVWRVDRMATAVIPGTDRLNPEFAQLAKHDGAQVAICPAHRPQRKGVVEAAIRLLGGRWWRSARAGSMAEAQQHLDVWTVRVSDARRRSGSTIGELGAAEPLRRLPPLAFPAEIRGERVASRSALVAFEANRYSVPPAFAGKRLIVRARVGEPHLQILSAPGPTVATHRRETAGAGQTIRSAEHAAALEQAVLDGSPPRRAAGARSTGRPASARWPSSPCCTATPLPPRRRRSSRWSATPRWPRPADEL